MEGLAVTPALMDAVPVLLFGGSIILAASKFGHPLFWAEDARSSRTVQFVNCAGQTCLMLGILFAG